MFPASIIMLKNYDTDILLYGHYDYLIYRIAAIEITFFALILRFATLGLFIERAIATVYFDKYESTKRFKIVGIMISIIGFTISLMMGAAYQTGLYSFPYHVGAVAIIDILNIIVSFLVFRKFTI